MTTTVFHGIKTNLLTTATTAITSVATAVIGMVCTATDADATAFPLNTPVLINDVRSALAKAGTTGTLSTALAAIADICSPTVIVVRVAIDAEGQDALVTGANVGGYTGLQALLTAEALTGSRPRILGTPGLSSEAVVTALAGIAQKLRGMAYAHMPATDLADAITMRANFGQRELMPIWPNTGVGGADVEARALGLRAYIDGTMGWNKTISNVEIPGVTGTDTPVTWGLDGDSTDAALLNNAQITTLIRRNGWRFWGNRTASSDARWAFESAVRTSQVLQDTIDDACFQFSDNDLTVGLVRDIVTTANAYFKKLKTQGYIIGATCWYDPASNQGVDLANGQLVLDYDFTATAPLEGQTFNQILTDKYYVDFSALLQTA